MKLSVSTYSLARWRQQQNKTLTDSLDWMAQHGVKWVEFSGLDAATGQSLPDRAAELLAYCQGKGLEVAGYCTGATLLGPSGRVEQAEAGLLAHIDAAAALGVRTMRHDLTRGWDDYPEYEGQRSFEAALELLVPVIRRLADYAQGKGVITTFENHGFYCQGAERTRRILEAADHPNFRLTLDMGNFLCLNDDPVRAVAQLRGWAVMAHAKDFHIKPKAKAPVRGWIHTPTDVAIRGAIAGHGDIDIPLQLQLLRDGGYRGYLSLEFEGMEDPELGVTEGLSFLRAELDKLGCLDQG